MITGKWRFIVVSALSAMAVAVASVVTPTSLLANTWPFDGMYPDKSTHSWCYHSSVSSTLKSYIPGAMDNLYTSTTIPGVPQHATCDSQNSNQDGDPATDVMWIQGNLNGAFGTAPCFVETASNSTHCDQRKVTIAASTIEASQYPHHQYIKTVCHELGHTAGFDHYSALASPPAIPPGGVLDCMTSGDVKYASNPTGSWIWQYNSHHISHANSWWP
ncbi:hypothetical protein [Streptosporangium sp. NPDC049376]|uniref:hypothetical protein n=1 Tax=Streptosporangium sp. NPDC049376 TaxID=3366192 RepID=UPI00379FDB33